MILQRPEFLVLLLSATALFLSIKLFGRLNDRGRESASFGLIDKLRKFESNRIFYLKNSEYPSDVLQNIVMRYGYLNGLDFFLPGWTFPGNSHIIIHEDRLNYTRYKRQIHPHTVWITSLSNPESYLSGKDTPSFRLFNDSNDTLNPMARRLGYTFPTFDSNYVNKFVDRLSDIFDLVLISEYTEVSLVLLSRLMLWPLESVVFLQREPTREISTPAGADRQKWRASHDVDSVIYSHFLRKLRHLVLSYGQNRMIRDLNSLMVLNTRFNHICSIISNCQGTLKSDKELQCKLAEIDDNGFRELIKREQIRRTSVIKSLKNLLGTE